MRYRKPRRKSAERSAISGPVSRLVFPFIDARVAELDAHDLPAMVQGYCSTEAAM